MSDDSDRLIDGLLAEMLLFQSIAQVLIGKMIQRTSDPVEMLDSIRKDLLVVMAGTKLPLDDAVRQEKIRRHAADRARELIAPLGPKAKILAGASALPVSKPN